MNSLAINPLQKDFEFFLENRSEIIEGHLGKFVVIADQQVVGYFAGQIEAIERVGKERPIGTFLVQRCEPDEESYSQTFHSRAWTVKSGA